MCIRSPEGPPLTSVLPPFSHSCARTPMEVPLAKKRKKEESASNYSPQDDCGPQPTAQPLPEPSPGVGTPQGKWHYIRYSFCLAIPVYTVIVVLGL